MGRKIRALSVKLLLLTSEELLFSVLQKFTERREVQSDSSERPENWPILENILV